MLLSLEVYGTRQSEIKGAIELWWTTYRPLSTLVYFPLTEASRNIEQRRGTFFAMCHEKLDSKVLSVTQKWQLYLKRKSLLVLNIIPALIRIHKSCHISKDQPVFSSQRDCSWYCSLWFSQGRPWQYPHFCIYIIELLCIPLAPFIRGLIFFTDSNELMLTMPM